jgi:hypothetical protein
MGASSLRFRASSAIPSYHTWKKGPGTTGTETMKTKRTNKLVSIDSIQKEQLVGKFFVDRVPKVAVCYYVLSRVDTAAVLYWAQGKDWKSVLAQAYESLSQLEIIKKAA